MGTASLQFVAFGLMAAILSNLSRTILWRNAVLLIASLFLLGCLVGTQHWWQVVPFFAFLLLGYAGITAVRADRSYALPVSVAMVVFAYLWLKKYTFLPTASFLPFPYFVLGLSYIFFRILSLLVVVSSDGGERKHVTIGSYLIYLLNFPTFVSGPIQSYEDFARDQFADNPIELNVDIVAAQIGRIVLGFFKVNVLAMLLHAVQEDALSELAEPIPAAQQLFAVFRLIVVYPFFLYANFSGYIDIVIALARLLRIRLPENFDRPFSATSFIDFWNRWHITLSLWLKTHVFNPLLMALMQRFTSARAAPILAVICFFVTFFLIGIWHGRTSEFAMFGVLQGGGVAANKIWQLWLTRLLGKKRYRQAGQTWVYAALSRGLTFTWFAFTLFWFWASWKQLALIAHAVSPMDWIKMWLVVWLAASAVLDGWERLRAALLRIEVGGEPLATGRYALVVFGTLLGFVALLVTVVLDQPAPDVVYKAF